eukprot:1158280-Pelagomonas_calceolata.AAC.9
MASRAEAAASPSPAGTAGTAGSDELVVEEPIELHVTAGSDELVAEEIFRPGRSECIGSGVCCGLLGCKAAHWFMETWVQGVLCPGCGKFVSAGPQYAHSACSFCTETLPAGSAFEAANQLAQPCQLVLSTSWRSRAS